MSSLTLDHGRRGAADVRRALGLTLHLAGREVASAHRLTLLGWLWPVVRQVVQLAVLVFAFTKVIDLDIPGYPVLVFTGLLAWAWFSQGVGAASTAVLTRRHLAFQPGFPVAVLPVVAIAVPFVDVLMGLPVLLVLLIDSGGLQWTALAVPLVAAIQLALMVGVAWLVAALTVYYRDVPNLVGVVLTVGFYVTPVFFPLSRVPEDYVWALELNPVAGLIESYRSLLLDGTMPAVQHVAVPAGFAVVLLLAGFAAYRRLAGDFVDEL